MRSPKGEGPAAIRLQETDGPASGEPRSLLRLLRALTLEDGLRGLTARGFLWTGVGKVAEAGSSLLKVLILARLLAAEDFGLMGIALLAFGTLETFSESGFRAALVRNPDDIESYLDTSWVVGMIRGALLSLLLAAAAPWIDGFFRAPGVRPVIYALALLPAIRGVSNPAVIHFLRDLDFRKQLWFQLVGTLPSLLAAVALGWWMHSVWALVLAAIVDEAGRCVASYWLVRRRPRLHFDWAKAKELAAFGRWVLTSGVVSYLIVQGDRIFVGRLLGAALLGYYGLGLRLATTVTVEIAYLLNTVCLPLYARIQADLPRLRFVFFRVLALAAAVVLPAAVALSLFSQEAVQIALGDQWGPAASVVGPLAFAGALRALAATGAPLFTAVGRPKMDAQMNIARLLVLLLAFPPLILGMGLRGAGFAVLASTLAAMPGWVYGVRRIVGAGWQDFWRALRPALLSSAILLVVGIPAHLVLATSHSQRLLLGAVLVGLLLPSGWIVLRAFKQSILTPPTMEAA